VDFYRVRGNFGFIWAPLLETILQIGGHLWWLGGSKWHGFYSGAFDMATRRCSVQANVLSVQ